MKKIFVLLGFIFILSSCSIDWNGEKDKKIAELEKQVFELKNDNKDKIFHKKQECLQYESKMLSWGKENYGVWKMGEIFYSDLKNSCYFIGTITQEIDWNIVRDYDVLFDYFSKQKIIEVPKGMVDSNHMDNGEFINKIKELKGE